MHRKIFSVAVVIALAGALLDITFDIPLSPKRSLNLGMFDILLWPCLAGVILCNSLRNGENIVPFMQRVAKACWPGLLFCGIAVASALYSLGASDHKVSVILVTKTLIQYVEYLVAAPFIFLPFLEGYRSMRLLTHSLQFILLIAFVGFFAYSLEYPSGIAVCILGMLLLGNELIYTNEFHINRMNQPRKSLWEIDLKRDPGVLAAFTAILTSIWLVVGFAAGLMLTSRLQKRWNWLLVIFIFIVSITSLYYAYPERYRKLFTSIQTYREHKPEGAAFAIAVPTMRYYRWYANLNMIADKPILGQGTGAYNKALKNYYGTLDVPEGRTDIPELYDLQAHQPYTFSAYGVIGAECGLLGLGALLLLFVELLARGVRGGNNLGYGIAGAALLLIIGCLWTNPLVRVSGPFIGFMLAASVMNVNNRDNADENSAAPSSL